MTVRWPLGKDTAPSAELCEAIVGLLNAEETVILPTDTLYGLHGKASSAAAAEKIGNLKGREDTKPYVVLCTAAGDLARLGVTTTEEIVAYLTDVWPASLTAILPIVKAIPASRGRLTLAVRVPPLPWLRELLEKTGPLISTSVNLSGSEPARSVEQVDPLIASRVAGIVDSGSLSGRASTIVDFSSTPPTLVRQGDFTFAQNLWKKARKSL